VWETLKTIDYLFIKFKQAAEETQFEDIRLATVRSGPDRGLFWRLFKKTGLYGPAPSDCSSVPKILDRTVRSGQAFYPYAISIWKYGTVWTHMAIQK
jgi:hypothetical protein